MRHGLKNICSIQEKKLSNYIFVFQIGKSFYYIKCHAQNKWKKQVFDWYQKGDYLILEGSLRLNTFKLYNFKSKYLEVSIIKDFPMNLQI